MSTFTSECRECGAKIAWEGTVSEFLEMDSRWSATHPCFAVNAANGTA